MALVDRVVADGGGAGRAHDQHDSIQQLQGHSLDAEAAVLGDRIGVLASLDGLEILRTPPGRSFVLLCRHRRCVASGEGATASRRIPDRVIHAIA